MYMCHKADFRADKGFLLTKSTQPQPNRNKKRDKFLPRLGGFAVGAEPVRRPGEHPPREGVSSKNGSGRGGEGGVMREIGALL
jgi:hypothetical protein